MVIELFIRSIMYGFILWYRWDETWHVCKDWALHHTKHSMCITATSYELQFDETSFECRCSIIMRVYITMRATYYNFAIRWNYCLNKVDEKCICTVAILRVATSLENKSGGIHRISVHCVHKGDSLWPNNSMKFKYFTKFKCRWSKHDWRCKQ